MRKFFILTGLLFVFGAMAFLPIYDTTATNATIAERFSGDAKKDEGATGEYKLDPAHSTIGFRVKHMGLIEVPGYFRDFTAMVSYDAKDVSKSTVEFSAKTTSVDTGVAPRDKHLRTADFFDVEKFPEMTFKSTKIEKKGKQWMMTGDLTMKGVTKSISFPFTVAGFLPGDKGTRMGVTAETTINRRDFGVNYGTNLPNGTPMLSDNIAVVLQLEALMSKPMTDK